MAMLVRGEDIVWRSEEMWWSVRLSLFPLSARCNRFYPQFNTPVQLGPSSAALPSDAHVFTLPVQADDILILASDGLSDNLWDEDVLDETLRFRHSFLEKQHQGLDGVLRRKTMAGMLSEALCSRAKKVSEWRVDGVQGWGDQQVEVPFARRARENKRTFRGGKTDGE
jgi:hypothetical protein